jgi:hypothetical protein
MNTKELVAPEKSLVQALVPFGKNAIVLFQVNDNIVHDIKPLFQVDVAVLVGITYFAQIPEVLLKVLLQSAS